MDDEAAEEHTPLFHARAGCRLDPPLVGHLGYSAIGSKVAASATAGGSAFSGSPGVLASFLILGWTGYLNEGSPEPERNIQTRLRNR
jgi:hypothetical protein